MFSALHNDNIPNDGNEDIDGLDYFEIQQSESLFEDQTDKNSDDDFE